MAGGPGGGHQFFAGVADARQAGITDQGQGITGRQGRQQLWDAPQLVVLVEAHQRRTDAKAMQQQTAVAGVFAGDARHPRQHQLGPGGEVAAVADRRTHQVKHAGGGFRALAGVRAGLLHNAGLQLFHDAGPPAPARRR